MDLTFHPQELLKNTPPEHEDFTNLSAASEKIDAVAMYLNTKKKEFEYRLKLIEIAQNDDHPGQMAALKMAVDRILPASVFEAKKDGSRVAVNITISGLGGEVIDVDDVTDV